MYDLAQRMSSAMYGNKCSKVFTPYMRLCSIFGICHPSTDSFIRRVYALLCLLFISFCLIRGISFLFLYKETFSPTMVFKLLLVLYATHCLCGFVTLMAIRCQMLDEFVSLWRYVNNYMYEQIPNYVTLQMMTAIGVLYVLLLSVINGLFVGAGSANFIISFPFIRSYLFVESIAWANGLIVAFTSVAFAMPQTMFCSICFVLYFEFRALADSMQNATVDEMDSSVVEYRQKHFKLCQLTDQADRMLSYYAFAIYVFNLPTLIMTTFLVVRHSNMNQMSHLVFIAWVCVLTMQVGIVSIIPAMINYQAHRPFKYLRTYSNCMSDGSSSSSSLSLSSPSLKNSFIFHETSLFLRSLSIQEIGLTGGGFFVITKSFILTLISVVVTYFAVILQFDMAAEVPCVCTC